MYAEVFIAVELDPRLSAAIAADSMAGSTVADMKHVLNDIQRVMQAALLRGDSIAEEHIADLLRKFR